MESKCMHEVQSPTLQERVLSALAHLSILAGGIGLFVPALIWATKRRTSNYTSFQALQALGYAIFAILYDLLVTLVMLIVLLILLLAISASNEIGSVQATSAGHWMVAILMIAIAFLLLPVLLGIIGALACLFGKEFHYPILGKRLAVYLQQGRIEGIDLDHEDRYVAAVIHACVLFVYPAIPYYIAAPLVALLSSKGRSQLLHFQSLQALVFQLLGTVVSFGFIMVMAGMLISAMIFSGINPITGAMANSSSTPAVILLLAAMLIFLIFLLFLPVIQTFGLVASYRVLKGKNYEYPLVGKLVKNWSWI